MTTSSASEILISILIFAILLGLVLLLRNLPNGARQRMMQRMREVTEEQSNLAKIQAQEVQSTGTESDALLNKITHRIVVLGDMIPLLDAKQRTELGVQLTRAGFRDRKAVSVLIGIKLIVGACCAFLGAVFASSVPFVTDHFSMRVVFMAAAFMIGMIWPETVLSLLISRRQKKISSYFPDALDLMVICTNAGNSLSISIMRVANELQKICPPLSDEFKFTADQLQLDGDSASALRNMSKRIGIQSMRSLVTTLIQSQQYGTPISQSLKTLSRSERTAQLLAMEEKAAKLAAKMTIPMILFILPTVGIVTAGPAILNLMNLFNP